MLEFPAACCNERVSAARGSRPRRRALMTELAAYVYGYPRTRLPNMDEDIPGDFYLFCHHKLGRMIDQFEDRGIPFEHYVNAVLRWQLRSYLQIRNDAKQNWLHALYSGLWDDRGTLAEQQRALDPALGLDSALSPPRKRTAAASPRPRPRAPALHLADPTSSALKLRAAPNGRRPAVRFRLPRDPARRSMLYLLLKVGHRADGCQLAALIDATGCHPDSLQRLFGRVERLTMPARVRRTLLYERRNQAFSDFQYWATAAWLETEAPAREQAQRRAARRHATLVKARFELSRVRTAPSNRLIASLLGVPKGTVDTALGFLRRDKLARYLLRRWS